MPSTDHQQYPQCRTRHRVTTFEKQAIRRKHRQNHTWTQHKLAQWASEEFGRPIRQSVISDALRAKADVDEAQEVVQQLLLRPSNLIVPFISHDNSDLLWLQDATEPYVYTNDLQSNDPDDDEEQKVPALPRKAGSRIRTSEWASQCQQCLSMTHTSTPITLFIGQLFTGLVSKASSMGRQNTDMMTRWLLAVANRWHHSLSLHEAVQSVLIYHAGIVTGDDRFKHFSRAYYGRALNLVRKAISSGKDLNTDTVSAVILLSNHDVFGYSDEHDASRHHTKGAEELIAFLGPEQFDNDYGQDILLAFATQRMFYLAEEAMAPDFFLRKPEWIQVLAKAHRNIKANPMRRAVAHEILDCTMVGVTLRRQVDGLEGEGLAEATPQLLQQLFKLRARLHKCVDKWLPASNTPAGKGSRRRAVNYSTSPEFWCGYAAVIVSTNRLITRLQPGMDFSEEEEDVRRELEEAAEALPIMSFLARRSIFVFDRSR